ncbi:MAG: MBL fold metallo-hydrolase [Burkholderiales bacterium]|nr:MAG: MBL fold metallo-hydrolase [Burkholderiales bacterium]
MTEPPAIVEALGHGVHAIDTGFYRARYDAAYLVVHAGRGAFIDTGTTHSLPRLLASLATVGLALEQVDYVIPTHAHLDHAGGAGALMRALPAAMLVAHPRAAPHLIDPQVLLESARSIYGDDHVERAYGEVPGIDPARVITTHDGMTLELGGRVLRFIDTPGHARHHHCIWDVASRGFFTGDTFGVSYRELHSARGAFIMPTTPPTQFEPQRLRASIERMLAEQPDCMYLTHYGCVTGVPALGRILLQQIDELVALAESLRTHPQRQPALEAGVRTLMIRWVREHGCDLPDDALRDLLELDVELNAQGIATWLDRRH